MIKSLIQSLSNEVFIDCGSRYTKLYIPSTQIKEILESSIEIDGIKYFPIHKGEISDFNQALDMFNEIIHSARKKSSFITKHFLSPRLYIIVHYGIPEVQIAAYRDIVEQIGAMSCKVFYEGIASSFVSEGFSAVCSLGDFKSEIIIRDSLQIFYHCAIDFGLAHFAKYIAQYLKQKYSVIIEESEGIKMFKELANKTHRRQMEVEFAGIDIRKKTSVAMKIASSELELQLKMYFEDFNKSIRLALSSVPKEIQYKVLKSGWLFVGGFVEIAKMEKLLTSIIKTKITIFKSPQFASVIGAANLIKSEKALEKFEIKDTLLL